MTGTSLILVRNNFLGPNFDVQPKEYGMVLDARSRTLQLALDKDAIVKATPFKEGFIVLCKYSSKKVSSCFVYFHFMLVLVIISPPNAMKFMVRSLWFGNFHSAMIHDS